MNSVHESMTPIRIQFGPKECYLKIRVWRTEENFSLGHNDDLYEAALALELPIREWELMQDVVKMAAQKLGTMPRVSAVEVLIGETGRGIVYYPDWS